MANEAKNTTSTTSAKSEPVASLRTKHVAGMLNIKPVALRRILRSMPRYADGVHTNYRWDPKDSKAIEEIRAQMKVLADKKAKAAEAAKANLAKAQEAKTAQEKLDKKAS